MMQVFKISMLWLAGLLIVGHGILPHHHHAETHQCASDKHEHHVSAQFSLQCSCDTPESEETCHFQQNTLLDNGKLLSAAITPGIESVFPVLTGKHLIFDRTQLHCDKEFHRKKPSRAPPVC